MPLERTDALALLIDSVFVELRCREQVVDKVAAEFGSQAMQQFAREVNVFVEREAKAEAELGIVFEQ